MFFYFRRCFPYLLVLFIVCGACSREVDEAINNCIEAPSPHHDARPSQTVDTIVLHASGLPSLGHVTKVFQSRQFRVSSHYTVGKKGQIACHVKEEQRAWHAGESALPPERKGVNDFSIGIELINLNNGTDPYPPPQVLSAYRLIESICRRHPIRYIASHAAIALPPGRKNDPVGLDIASFATACSGATIIGKGSLSAFGVKSTVADKARLVRAAEN